MKTIFDPTFKYKGSASHSTSASFRQRQQKRMKEAAEAREAATAELAEKVRKIGGARP